MYEYINILDSYCAYLTEKHYFCRWIMLISLSFLREKARGFIEFICANCLSILLLLL